VEVVGEAADGVTLLETGGDASRRRLHLDLTMPRLNGLDTARELLKRRPTARILILSLHDSRALVEAALQIGCPRLHHQGIGQMHVTEAVCEVYAGRLYLSPDIAHLLVERSDGTERRAELSWPCRR